jgi:hypothetical protein
MRTFLRRLLAPLAADSPSHDPIHDEAVRMQTALGLLSDRYLQIADQATTDVGRARAMQIRQAGKDIRHALINGRIPAYLMTEDELDELADVQDAELVDEGARS